MNIHGRDKEVSIMKRLLDSENSEFLAVTGRRRIGKTYLVDTVYAKHSVFSMTGIKDAAMEEQLAHFTDKLRGYAGKSMIQQPSSWQEAFILLKQYLQQKRSSKKQVLFFDELPWLATPRSLFLQMLGHFWNDFLSKEKKYILVICGSFTSWIVRKVYNDKGGLHNRITAKINLQPFSLKETKQYLTSRGIQLTDNALAEIYMIMGGIPYYLNAIQRGDSSTTAMERICFTIDGLLYDEYQNLFKALYDRPENHEAIVKALSQGKQGLSRKELLSKSKVEAGGPFTRAMQDLVLSGFVEEQAPFGKKKRGVTYRLIDEYSIFHNRFISKNRSSGKGIWQKLSAGQSYRIWRGYAFESLCLRHLTEIKAALGIGGVYTEVSSYRLAGNDEQTGFQIDILLDRADNCINLCECKYHEADYVITKNYATQLRNRKAAFSSSTKTKKSVFTTLITNYPVVDNKYALETVDARVELSALFL